MFQLWPLVSRIIKFQYLRVPSITSCLGPRILQLIPPKTRALMVALQASRSLVFCTCRAEIPSGFYHGDPQYHTSSGRTQATHSEGSTQLALREEDCKTPRSPADRRKRVRRVLEVATPRIGSRLCLLTLSLHCTPDFPI